MAKAVEDADGGFQASFGPVSPFIEYSQRDLNEIYKRQHSVPLNLVWAPPGRSKGFYGTPEQIAKDIAEFNNREADLVAAIEAL